MELRQRPVAAERLADGGRARVGDLVEARVEDLEGLVDLERRGQPDRPLALDVVPLQVERPERRVAGERLGDDAGAIVADAVRAELEGMERARADGGQQRGDALVADRTLDEAQPRDRAARRQRDHERAQRCRRQLQLSKLDLLEGVARSQRLGDAADGNVALRERHTGRVGTRSGRAPRRGRAGIQGWRRTRRAS